MQFSPTISYIFIIVNLIFGMLNTYSYADSGNTSVIALVGMIAAIIGTIASVIGLAISSN